MLFIDDSMTPN